MTKNAINPETHHPRTGAKRTDTPEVATARPGPTPAQINAAQQREPEHIDRQGNIVKVEQLPTPIELTDEQRAANLVRNMAAVGSQFLTRFDFEAVKGVFEMDGDEHKPGLCICPVREIRLGYRRFNGEGNPMDLATRRLDEGDLYTRDDLDGGHEEEDGQYGRRFRWQDYAIVRRSTLATAAANCMASRPTTLPAIGRSAT
jgi:hypothetical protein